MNPFGLLTGIATLFIIGLGFPLVIRGERLFGWVVWPYMLGIGILLIAASLFIAADFLAVTVGVLGATFIWGSTELKEQAVRVERGWYPNNPRKIRVPFAEKIQTWKAPHL
ncbi:MAG: DUF4491 family protein [Anaerolineales bacterium]